MPCDTDGTLGTFFRNFREKKKEKRNLETFGNNSLFSLNPLFTLPGHG